MRNPTTLLLWITGWTIWLASSPTQVRSQVDVRWIPPEAVAAVVIQPESWWRSPVVQLMPTELFSLESRKLLGLTPDEIRSVLAFGGLPHPEGEPRFGIVLELTRPVELEEVFPAHQRQGLLRMREHPRTNVQYLESSQADFVSVYPINDTTFLMAPPSMLDMLLMRSAASEAVSGELAELVRRGRHDAVLRAHAVIPPVRDAAKFLLASPQLPESFRFLGTLPDLVRHMELDADFSSPDGGFTLRITSPDPAAAEKLEAGLSRLLETATSMMAERAESPAIRDAQTRALAQYQARMMALFRDALQPTREAERITITTVGNERLPPEIGMAGAAAVMMPILAGAQASAARDSSVNKLKMILLALHNYHDTHGHFPARASRDAEGRPLLSWRVHVLPFLGEHALYQQFRLDEPWDSEHNIQFARTTPRAYGSSAHPELAGEGKTRFQYLLGEGLPASTLQELHLRHITDGSSNTLAVAEVPPEHAVVWSQPSDLEVDLDDPIRSLVGEQADGFLGARYDGSVRFYDRHLRNKTLKKLLTHAGGEIVDQAELD